MAWLEHTGIPRLVTALRAWILFGGLGARTTRGFGSLKLHGLSVDDHRTSETVKAFLADEDITRRPASSRMADLIEFFRTIPVRTPQSGSRPWPALAGSTLLLGPAQRDPLGALCLALECLREFRQGEGIGRAARTGNTPGRSHWPEPDAMKLLWEDTTGRDWNTELRHPRNQGHPIRKGADRVTPRAAFGMPLNISFHDQHQFDQRANGHIVPWDSERGAIFERFRSPVRLGVLPCRDDSHGDKYVPMVLILNVDRPAPAITFDDKKIDRGPRAVSLAAPGGVGAQQPIQTYLNAAGGDALKAWADFLASKKGFQKTVFAAQGGTP